MKALFAPVPLLFTALLVTAPPAQEGTLTVLHARVFTGSGPVLEGAALVVRQGKVAAVVPAGGEVERAGSVVDARGAFLTPGLVDANTTHGLNARDANERSAEVTPHLRAMDGVDPRDVRFRRALDWGVTAVHVAPGTRSVMGGLGCVLKTHGRTVREMVVREDTALRMALGRDPTAGNRPIRGGLPDTIFHRRPTTRMGVVWEVRKAFHDALLQRDLVTTLDGGGGPGALDPATEVLLRVLDGEIAVRATARAEQDIRTALRLAGEFGYRVVLDEAVEAWRVPELIAAAGVPVVAAAPSEQSARDGAEVRWSTPAVLADHGVTVALQTADGSLVPLIHEAALAARNGLDPLKALEAVTSAAAAVLGVADRVGSLEPGRDADFVLWDGHPLDLTSRPDKVYIEGIRRK